MKNMIVGAAACVGMLLAGYSFALANDDWGARAETISLKTVDRQSGYAMPDFSTSTPYASLINKYAAEYNVPVALAQAVVRVESNFNPNARGSAGEVGL
ncbi:transglycosylase SLT domain-containing protein, partial [Rhizobium ruizarguesonis]